MVSIHTIAGVAFLIFLLWFVYKRKDEIELQKIIFPLLYFAMWRTKFGLKWMDDTSKYMPRVIKALGVLGIIAGFAGMAYISYELLLNTIKLIIKPAITPGILPVLPIKIKGVFFVPFIYWILSIFIIAVVHEFAHGLVARAHSINVKSSGLAFLGILIPVVPAAFVEPDEKALEKRRKREQLSVFAAGPFANVLLAFAVLLLFIFALRPLSNATYEPQGAEIYSIDAKGPAALTELEQGDVVIKANGKDIATVGQLSDTLKSMKPGEKAVLQTANAAVEIVAAQHPRNESMPYFGVQLSQYSDIKKSFATEYPFWSKVFKTAFEPVNSFISLLFLLSLGIGLFNLLPLGPIDGGRMLKTALQHFIRDEKKSIAAWKWVSMIFLAMVLANLFAGILQ